MENLKNAIADNIGSWCVKTQEGTVKDGIHCYIRGGKVYAEELSGLNKISMSYANAVKLADGYNVQIGQLSIF